MSGRAGSGPVSACAQACVLALRAPGTLGSSFVAKATETGPGAWRQRPPLCAVHRLWGRRARIRRPTVGAQRGRVAASLGVAPTCPVSWGWPPSGTAGSRVSPSADPGGVQGLLCPRVLLPVDHQPREADPLVCIHEGIVLSHEEALGPERPDHRAALERVGHVRTHGRVAGRLQPSQLARGGHVQALRQGGEAREGRGRRDRDGFQNHKEPQRKILDQPLLPAYCVTLGQFLALSGFQYPCRIRVPRFF